MAQETAANTAAQAAAQAVIALPPTPTPSGPSQAPGDPDTPTELALITFGGCIGGGQNEFMDAAGLPTSGGSQCPAATTNNSPEILLPDGSLQPVGTCLSGSVAFFYGIGLGGCRVGVNQVNGYTYGTTASVGLGIGLEVSAGGSVLYSNVDFLRDLGGWSTCLSLSLAAISGEYCWWSGYRSFAGSVSTGANLSTLISESILATKGVGFHKVYTWTSLTQQLQAAPAVCWYSCKKKGYD